jgi:hypothetical protein
VPLPVVRVPTCCKGAAACVRVPLPVEGCRCLSRGAAACCGGDSLWLLLCMPCLSQPWGFSVRGCVLLLVPVTLTVVA